MHVVVPHEPLLQLEVSPHHAAVFGASAPHAAHAGIQTRMLRADPRHKHGWAAFRSTLSPHTRRFAVGSPYSWRSAAQADALRVVASTGR